MLLLAHKNTKVIPLAPFKEGTCNRICQNLNGYVKKVSAILPPLKGARGMIFFYLKKSLSENKS